MKLDLSAYDTDKSPIQLDRYRREFGDIFDDPIALLELGVQRGGSMRMWLDLLPNAQIAGLDLNEVEVDDDSGRLHIFQGFQQDPEVLDRIALEVAPHGFDVIVDDASHIGTYTSESFWHLFPNHLKPGGVYVIDDWSCGYLDDWADGHAYKGSREALGDFGPAGVQKAASELDRIEKLRRVIRRNARPVAARFSPATRERLEKVYMRFEGATMKTRHRSHDYGMVGFVKQLVDASAIKDIDGGSKRFSNQIESVHVEGSQVFVRKCLT